MTTTLQNIVDVTVDLQTQGVTRKSFGIPCIAGFHEAWGDQTRVYNATTILRDLVLDDEMGTEAPTGNIGVGTPIYRAAASIVGGTRAPQTIVVGRLDTTFTQTVTIKVLSAADYQNFSFRVYHPANTLIGGALYTDISVDGDSNATAAEIAALIDTAVDAIAGLSCDTTTDTVTITAVAGSMWYFDNIDERYLQFEDITADGGLVDDMDEIRTENNNWYGLILADPNSNARITALAADGNLATSEQIMGYTTRDGAVGTIAADDVMSLAQDNSNLRVFGIYSGDQTKHAAATWMGQMFATDPGSATWAYKTLPGIGVDDLTSAFTGYIDAKGGNWYENIAGLNLTQTGQMSSAEWIDVIRGRDWLVARLRERIANLLFNAPKIPYTDPGIGMIEGEVIAQLEEGISQGYLAADPAPVVTVPAVADVSTADKTARVLRDVLFEATLQGAIHKVVINGVLKS